MFWHYLLDILRYYILPILDILAVAFLLYKTYMILYGTRAMLVLKGLVIIGIIFFTSLILQLQTLNLLIRVLFTYGIIAFIVVFQPEIRRALMRVGENKFFTTLTKGDASTLSEIIDAVKFLSKKKTGALIVFKRQAGLRNIESTGVHVDGSITSELIITLFSKNSPLHDGALLIEAGRIAFASCFLPLTEKKAPRRLGTRHRAAIGLSEESDAVIIVVSEETGRISIAFKGDLKT
ncbi:MAG: diadenylate cyclase CdaA, partial [Spirochaetes bacterium]|nr:diadenylate cyclase CdaA [Spirochaetota bacterium]